jgi:hypothetical protein
VSADPPEQQGICLEILLLGEPAPFTGRRKIIIKIAIVVFVVVVVSLVGLYTEAVLCANDID